VPYSLSDESDFETDFARVLAAPQESGYVTKIGNTRERAFASSKAGGTKRDKLLQACS
jgi:hypothetical protein